MARLGKMCKIDSDSLLGSQHMSAWIPLPMVVGHPYIIYLLCRWSSRQTFHNFVVPVDGPRPIQALLSLPGPAPPSHSPSRLPACPFSLVLRQATSTPSAATRPRLFVPSQIVQMPLAVTTTTISISSPFPSLPVLGSFHFPMLSLGCF